LHVLAGVHAKELPVRADEGPARESGTEKPGARTEARRRLLRGAFAVPTVLTLSSGSALARSSSVRAFDNWEDAFPVPQNVRTVSRYTATLTDGTTTRPVVKASDISDMQVDGVFETTSFAGGKSWIDVGNGDNYTAADFKGGVEPSVPDTSVVALKVMYTETPAPGYFTVVGLAFDATTQTGSGKMLPGSAWCSFQGLNNCTPTIA
jgi:hypothetical protein